jgi:hypothetical protein
MAIRFRCLAHLLPLGCSRNNKDKLAESFGMRTVSQSRPKLDGLGLPRRCSMREGPNEPAKVQKSLLRRPM